jgi:hypothetical protein
MRGARIVARAKLSIEQQHQNAALAVIRSAKDREPKELFTETSRCARLGGRRSDGA